MSYNSHIGRKFISLRIINEWNKLPQDVVDAPSINTFKNTLDRHKHDMMTLSWPATQLTTSDIKKDANKTKQKLYQANKAN